MKVVTRLFGYASCHVEIDDVKIWFNPRHAWECPEQDAASFIADWCLLVDADLANISAVASWAGSVPSANFVAPPLVAAALLDAGLTATRVVVASSEARLIAPGLQVRAISLPNHRATHSEIQTSYLVSCKAGALLLASAGNVQSAGLKEFQSLGSIDAAFLPIGEHVLEEADSLAACSARHAFQFAKALGVRQVVAACSRTTPHGLYPEELRLVHERSGAPFTMLLSPSRLKIGPAKASVVVRTLNEALYLRELLEGIANQQTEDLQVEVVLVDSGSTDDTLAIAERYGCRILHIKREDFSFGRSLNIGCEAADGDILVITSGHCVPADPQWLLALCQPLLDGKAEYSYGKQLGGTNTYFSEIRIFEKYFPSQSQIPQQGFYCNNANSALLKSTWKRFQFDEELTGLEDMELAQRLVKNGGKVAYVAEARVYHYHSETWAQVRRRFEREAIALQSIMPNVHVSFLDAVRYTVSSVWRDWVHARNAGVWMKEAREIALYRYYQYSGSYKGNREHRMLSHAEKDKYFYPH